MNIAILGATSQIAKDLIRSFANITDYKCSLFSRNSDSLVEWLQYNNITKDYEILDYSSFSGDEKFDVIINFIGVGNPAKALSMGASIFHTTLEYDLLVLSYLVKNPTCKYIFLSSGAVYGSNFNEPVDINSEAHIPINNLKQQDWYGVAKLYAESRHRALPDLSIVDIRLFNYYSYSQNISARFLISDVLRAIQSNTVLITSPNNIVRDYIGPHDFYCLISQLISFPTLNDVVDSYTKEPVDKFTLFLALKEKFGFEYEVDDSPAGLNATGMKMNYFSVNRKASEYGYLPTKTSLDSVLEQSELLLDNIN